MCWLHGPKEEGPGYLEDVGVGAALMGLTVLRVLQEHSVHVCAGILEEAVGTVEDDEGDLTVAEYTQLIGFLHQPKLPLGKCHLDPGPMGGWEKTRIWGDVGEVKGPVFRTPLMILYLCMCYSFLLYFSFLQPGKLLLIL